jgi:hypothetical protein
MFFILFNIWNIAIMHCDSANKIWDKLHNVYEGDSEVKDAKLQTYRGQFEQSRMKEDEKIVAYFYELMKQ